MLHLQLLTSLINEQIFLLRLQDISAGNITVGIGSRNDFVCRRYSLYQRISDVFLDTTNGRLSKLHASSSIYE